MTLLDYEKTLQIFSALFKLLLRIQKILNFTQVNPAIKATVTQPLSSLSSTLIKSQKKKRKSLISSQNFDLTFILQSHNKLCKVYYGRSARSAGLSSVLAGIASEIPVYVFVAFKTSSCRLKHRKSFAFSSIKRKYVYGAERAFCMQFTKMEVADDRVEQEERNAKLCTYFMIQAFQYKLA